MSKAPLLDRSLVQDVMRLPSLPDTAYRVVRRRDVSGGVKPGARLNERDLARELSVGTSTVRDALNRLAANGFVLEEPYKGFRAGLHTAEYERDSGHVFSALEQLAAKNATSQQLARMHQVCAQTICGSSPDVLAFKQAHRGFRSVISQAAQRPALSELVDQKWHKYIPRPRYTTPRRIGRSSPNSSKSVIGRRWGRWGRATEHAPVNQSLVLRKLT